MIPRKNIKRLYHKALSEPGYAGKAFFKRARSYVTYRLFKGWSAYPETISILLTYQCNLRCKMCGQWGETGSSKYYTREMLNQKLDMSNLKRLVDDISSFKPTITLFGGEPLMHKHWDESVSYIKSHGLRCNMITNGTLLERHAEQIVSTGIDEIILSLDGPEEIHDRIRGKVGAFTRLIEGVKKINGLKAELRKNRPIFNINSTIFDFNYRYMEKIIEVAVSLNAKTLTFHHLIFLGEDTYERHSQVFWALFNTTSFDWAGFVEKQLPDIDAGYLINEIERIESADYGIPISFYPNLTEQEIRNYYSSFEFVPTSYPNRCLSPWMVAYVFPDGSVRPCLSLNYAVGSIKQESFRNIWNNERYTRFRNIVKQKRAFPVCTRCTEYYRF
jgi:radical SAM protein with 4Fe4S-binding SPASM domain